jgi:adenylate cyclase
MGVEIERKFLVTGDGWKASATGSKPVLQGYLCTGPPTAVRVRIAGESANINIKHATLDIERAEFEYPIPLDDARALLRLVQGEPVEKTRHLVPFAGKLWEVDVFEGANQGLVVAEIELASREESFELPPWISREVSGNPRYLNTSLSVFPFRNWDFDR